MKTFNDLKGEIIQGYDDICNKLITDKGKYEINFITFPDGTIEKIYLEKFEEDEE